MIRKFTIIWILLAIAGNTFAIETIQTSSPDKQVSILFSCDSLRGSPGIPAYQVFYNGKQFLRPSALGFQIAGEPGFYSFFQIAGIKKSEHRGSWKPVYGERNVYPDNYNETEIMLREDVVPHRRLKVVFRAYNEGVAFRFEFTGRSITKPFTIVRELTEFAFKENTYVWQEYGHEGVYSKVFSSGIKPDCELPLTVMTSDSTFGAIAEGGSSNYPRSYVQNMPLSRSSGDSSARKNPSTISIQLRGEAKGVNGYCTAWRMITLSNRPGGLMEQNYLLLNLNAPATIPDLSWIKPGKAIRDITLSTAGGKKYIDFARQHGIDYVILDWGWYGKPNAEDADPSYVNVVNPSTGKPIPGHTGLNLKELIAYGKSKGVGIWLYVNRQGVERYSDKIFPLYRSWGVKGIKPGFINVGNQEWLQWTETLVKKAAENHLMVDIHDAYRPTGLSRTYPNLLTQEGVRGNEHTPDADHTTSLPFTRYTIGAGDFTPGYCRSTLQNTWTHKLSLPVILYSPAQFMFWGEPISDCHERPELELWKELPVTWDDTRVLDGAISEYAVVARRKGSSWYVGGITNHEGRMLQVNFSFLDPGKEYEAVVYTDNAAANKVIIEKKTINSKTIIAFALLPSGGFAISLKDK